MGMTLKEMLRKGTSEGTVNADEVRALAQECGLDTESLYTILEERRDQDPGERSLSGRGQHLPRWRALRPAPTTTMTSRRRTAWRRIPPT